MTIYSAQWLVDKRVIFAYGEGNMTNQEMTIHNQRMIDLLDVGQAPIYTLLVTHPDTSLPKPNLATGRRILSFIRHENIGKNIVVHRPNSLMARMSVILAKIAGGGYRHFGSLDDALNYLQSIDDTIDWDSADMALLDVIVDYPPNASNSV